MSKLNNLEPAAVFDYFEQLCSIPHGSSNTRAAAKWLVNFALSHNLRYIADDYDNVIIFKNASPGRENQSPVILQGHIDMVCEKSADSSKDMSVEGLDLIVDGDFLRADGTTLGGDNGIAVAIMLALLSSDEYEHPPIEAVFTSDEEIGMIGAAHIDLSCLKGNRMLNLDSEAEGYFTVGCAGGNVTECTVPVTRSSYDGTAFEIRITGLVGGHSGIEIDKGRANANILMARLLCALSDKCEMRIIYVDGGFKDNAIPVASTARVCTSDAAVTKDVCRYFSEVFANEYRISDPGITVSCAEAEYSDPMDKASSQKLICMLSAVPDGVQSMSRDIPGLVQTSLNLGILVTGHNCIIAKFCVRSSVESQKFMLCDKLRVITEFLGGEAVINGDYPAWEYRADSPIRDLVSNVYTQMYGKTAVIETIHAGLECGIFASKIPDLDCISFGPDLLDIHTPRERVGIQSVSRLWNMLIEILRRLD